MKLKLQKSDKNQSLLQNDGLSLVNKNKNKTKNDKSEDIMLETMIDVSMIANVSSQTKTHTNTKETQTIETETETETTETDNQNDILRENTNSNMAIQGSQIVSNMNEQNTIEMYDDGKYKKSSI